MKYNTRFTGIHLNHHMCHKTLCVMLQYIEADTKVKFIHYGHPEIKKKYLGTIYVDSK